MRPFRLLLITALSVFLGEILVMLTLHRLPAVPMVAEAFMDGLLLLALIFPLLYLSLFRPMVVQISERKRVQEQLQKMNYELERRVEERTAELTSANDQLSKEVEDRRPQKELKKGQDFIVRVVELAPYMIVIYDLATDRCVYVNNRIADMLGYTVEDVYVMGSAFFTKILSLEALASLSEFRERLMTSSDDEVIEGEHCLKTASGDWHRFRVRMVVFARNVEGTPRQILLTASKALQ